MPSPPFPVHIQRRRRQIQGGQQNTEPGRMFWLYAGF
jgi:hypothetical protein